MEFTTYLWIHLFVFIFVVVFVILIPSILLIVLLCRDQPRTRRSPMAKEPMSKDDLWRRYIEKNPHWLTSGAVMTPDGIRRFFDQTFDLGHELGLANGKALAKQDGGSKSLFENIFGSKS